MNKFTLSLVTASLTTVAGGISLTYYFSDSLAVANAEVAPSQGQLQESSDSVAEPSLSAKSDSETEAIATTYDHEIEGREATTVYIRNIPVATFLGDDVSENTGSDSEIAQVATNSEELPLELPSNIIASQEFINALSQLEQEGTSAQKIGVKWDKEAKEYVIHLDQKPLIAMTGDVILPTTTKDKAEDALQITNRLRRQIGNVKPLKKIEGQPPKPKKVAVAPTHASRYQQGWASWYGPGFHGNLTANGTRYNQYGLTAAHRTLPFGTRLRVTNQNNGRSVVVVVNDRGPFIHNRVIDLSLGAAEVIGVTSSGIAPVTLDILN